MQTEEKWQEELKAIREIISKHPLKKTIKWGGEVFTYNEKNVVSYGGFNDYFAIWFYNGVFLKDPYKLLVNAQQGKTKSLRQWRFSSKTEIDERRISEYIIEAIEVEKNGLKIKPEKFKAIPVPQLLETELKRNQKLNDAFSKLTPGKQKEYSIFINEAKQESTKQNRIEKIKPMILQGIGLNDKYKQKRDHAIDK